MEIILSLSCIDPKTKQASTGCTGNSAILVSCSPDASVLNCSTPPPVSRVRDRNGEGWGNWEEEEEQNVIVDDYEEEEEDNDDEEEFMQRGNIVFDDYYDGIGV